jgi:tetratricopeptide (TPR) repeat protein
MLRTLTSLSVALALVVAPAVASAEEPTKSYPDCGREPTEAEVAAAKGAFQAGNASFNEADYARAIDYWEDAYRRDCTANPLLLNLARAYELAGRKRQAVVSLETFLAREPSSGEKDQINRRVEVLKKKIAEEDAAAAVAPPPTTAPTTTPLPPPVTEPATSKAKRSPGPWIVIGVGGAVAIIGTIGIINNKKKVDDFAADCDDPATKEVEGRDKCRYEVAQKGNDARTALNVSGVIAGVGVAAVAAGFVWFILDGKRVANAQGSFKRPVLTPIVSAQLAGLNLSGAF